CCDIQSIFDLGDCRLVVLVLQHVAESHDLSNHARRNQAERLYAIQPCREASRLVDAKSEEQAVNLAVDGALRVTERVNQSARTAKPQVLFCELQVLGRYDRGTVLETTERFRIQSWCFPP